MLPRCVAVLLLGMLLVSCQRTASPLGSTPAAPAAAAEQHVAGYDILLQPSTPHLGDNTFQVTVRDARAAAVDNASVTLQLSMPSMKMAGPTVSAQHGDHGVYTLPARLSMEGNWRAEVRVIPPGAGTLTAVFNTHTGGAGE